MHNIALNIRTKDWLYILLIGVLFSMLLSSLGYFLLQKSWFIGALFGIILGFSITTFSLAFISYMNKKMLPNIKESYWMPLAAFFSFFSGFSGTLFGTFLAKMLQIPLIEVLKQDLIPIALLIGILTYIVGLLLYFVVNMRNQKEQTDHEYVQSRLRSLETQLNPHFLSKSFNSIAELIHQDKDKAEMALLKVSTFLRNTMKEEALILLQNEIINVKDYIALENIRFSGKIQLNIEGAVPKWRVPKFSIQLLVENAIKHGFSNTMQELNILISCDEESKIVKVQNDGVPMKYKSFGVGLSNLKQRLELLCKGTLSAEKLENPTFYIHLGECCEDTNS